MAIFNHKKFYVNIISLVLFSIASAAATAHADIYMYIDGQGVLHFTNVPTSRKYRLYLRERTFNSVNQIHSNKYDHIINRASKLHGVSFPLLKAIIKVESDFNPRAVSKKGAKGLMQLMPEKIRTFKIKDPFDPSENIMAGARYIRELLDRYKGKVQLTLAAYNAGPSRVDRFQRIPPYKETENYIQKVMMYYRQLRKG